LGVEALAGDRVSVRIDLHRLGRRLGRVYRGFVTVEMLSEDLCISRCSAGKVLSALERLGYVERWNRRFYRIRVGGDGVSR